MAKPKECPKCRATSDEINNTEEMARLLGINEDHKKWLCTRCGYGFDDDEAVTESWYYNADLSQMKLSQIADVVIDNWKSVSPNALPYLKAMMNLNDISDRYGQDDAISIISYFLSNAPKWQGSVARKVKKYLRELVNANQLQTQPRATLITQ